MTTFEEREKAFEERFSHDLELRFRIEVRRNKLLGLWAAELMGLSDEQAEGYAKDMVLSMIEHSAKSTAQKALTDFQKSGVDLSEHRLKKKMDELLEKAKEQVMAE